MTKRCPSEMPNKIIVLGKTFTVMDIEEEDEDSDGRMSLAEQIIRLRKQGSIEYNQDTLLHELIHSVDEMLLLEMNEHQVHSLAVGLLSIIKQNKQLMKWFTINA